MRGRSAAGCGRSMACVSFISGIVSGIDVVRGMLSSFAVRCVAGGSNLIDAANGDNGFPCFSDLRSGMPSFGKGGASPVSFFSPSCSAVAAAASSATSSSVVSSCGSGGGFSRRFASPLSTMAPR
eukprot:scaffold3747_cov240-Pinguiococcus_pyrenoidosus.AAC.17